VRVVDGDTLNLDGERVRLANIDAPEMPPKSRCPAEAEGALAATARLETLVRGGDLTLERTGVDRYGRTLAHVYVDQADVGRSLIAAGLVRPWEGRRRSWCV
jgi:endonuclease YncB( thermonuclease family)